MHWLPPNGALHGPAFDHLLGLNLAIVFWLFMAAQVLLVLALMRRGAGPNRGGKARRSLLIVDYVVLAGITGLYVWMVASSHRLWAASRESTVCSPGVQVEVTGVQFQWYFRYPGPDGVYGRTTPRLVSAPTGNPLGLDPADAHAADDVVTSILVVPVGRPIDLTLRSQDVIHGFFVPGMRLKQDAIPGMSGHLHFTAETPGNYVILCSQVCGLGHYRMQARLLAMPTGQFDAWLTARERALAAEAKP